VSVGSDNGLDFVAEVVQLIAKKLKIKLTRGLLPPEFRKNKMYKHDLKITIKKLCQETHLLWDQLLPIALLRIKSSPTFEMLFWCPLL
jgi:hypothetical protein